MKNLAMFLVWGTTFFLVLLTVMAHIAIGFNWLFYLTLIGHVLVIIMVYKVLKDNYTTEKTFDEYFYQDHHIKRTDDSM